MTSQEIRFKFEGEFIWGEVATLQASDQNANASAVAARIGTAARDGFNALQTDVKSGSASSTKPRIAGERFSAYSNPSRWTIEQWLGFSHWWMNGGESTSREGCRFTSPHIDRSDGMTEFVPECVFRAAFGKFLNEIPEEMGEEEHIISKKKLDPSYTVAGARSTPILSGLMIRTAGIYNLDTGDFSGGEEVIVVFCRPSPRCWKWRNYIPTGVKTKHYERFDATAIEALRQYGILYAQQRLDPPKIPSAAILESIPFLPKELANIVSRLTGPLFPTEFRRNAAAVPTKS